MGNIQDIKGGGAGGSYGMVSHNITEGWDISYLSRVKLSSTCNTHTSSLQVSERVERYSSITIVTITPNEHYYDNLPMSYGANVFLVKGF